jgi:transcriptional regulator with XRE-family HTH domain
MAAQRHAGGRPRVNQYCPLGERIEQLAARRKMPLDVVAEEAGISLPGLYRILSGKIASPRWVTLKALADALGTKPEKLMAG